jgi:hypothetical protein
MGAPTLTGMHVTADINDHLRPEYDHLLQERLIASLSWRINDQGRTVPLTLQLCDGGLEDVLRGTGVE